MGNFEGLPSWAEGNGRSDATSLVRAQGQGPNLPGYHKDEPEGWINIINTRILSTIFVKFYMIVYTNDAIDLPEQGGVQLNWTPLSLKPCSYLGS